MNLVVFDIDGTLINTTSVDEECYVHAFKEEFGIDAIESDWGLYLNTTDEGILQEICTHRLGEKAYPDQIRRFRIRYIELLRAAVAMRPSRFAPMGGALALMANLQAKPEWCAALATGAWRDAAAVKFAAAGFDLPNVPLATCDDAIAREAIVTCAVKRSSERYDVKFDRIVSVGDGVWDARAASRLGLGFVGICSNASVASQMRAHGVRHMVVDFGLGSKGVSDTLKLFQQAARPVPESLVSSVVH